MSALNDNEPPQYNNFFQGKQPKIKVKALYLLER